MALRELNILNDCIEAISNQSLILDINNKAFLDDIQTLLVQYFETFNKVLNEMEYDNFLIDEIRRKIDKELNCISSSILTSLIIIYRLI